jgi:hypothetical protein
VNLLGGYARAIEPELAAFLEEVNPENLSYHYKRIQMGEDEGELDNLLYYALSKYMRHGTAEEQGRKPRRWVVMPFGKYKGKRFREIPTGYLRWGAARDEHARRHAA